MALWDELKDKLKGPAFDLSPGQQQRLCIARALAVEPEVLLMDESCSALDPESTMQVEGLMEELAKKYTILIVTHSMEQAARVSHMTAFMMMDEDRAGTWWNMLLQNRFLQIPRINAPKIILQAGLVENWLFLYSEKWRKSGIGIECLIFAKI